MSTLQERRAVAAEARNAVQDLIHLLQEQYNDIKPFPTDDEVDEISTFTANVKAVHAELKGEVIV